MAGRPMLRKLVEDIAKRGGEDYIVDRIADGESWGSIAKTFKVSRPLMYEWIKIGTEDEVAARRARIEEARRMSAEAHAEAAGEILEDRDTPQITAAEVSIGVARSNYEKWLAGIRDPKFSDRPASAQINVTIESLHLDALRAFGSRPAIEAGDVVEAEIISENDTPLIENADPVALLNDS